MKDYSNEWVIQPNSQCINLIDTIKFKEELNYENEDNENENENDDETMSQNEKRNNKKIKWWFW